MIEMFGQYNSCKIFANEIEKSTSSQISQLLKLEYLKNAQLRFMPDCCPGMTIPIGTVIDNTDYVISPAFISSDIGCGILAAKLISKDIDLDKLDKIIYDKIPSGKNVFDRPVFDISKLSKFKANININKANCSMGTLGGGNHFIEADKDSEGNIWILIHTGSRHLGTQVYEYWQKLAWERLKDNAAGGSLKEQTKRLTEWYANRNETKKLNKALKELRDNYKKTKPEVPYELAYLEDRQDVKDYISDVRTTQLYAGLNRKCILDTIADGLKVDIDKVIDSEHNFIFEYTSYDDELQHSLFHIVARKGAIGAWKDSECVIPLNMKDGALICKGKQNEDWLVSGPHGAGRKLSRQDARNSISMKDYKDSMEGIYSTSINTGTVDECCYAYKDSKEIEELIDPTVEIIDRLKPIYNFKAGHE